MEMITIEITKRIEFDYGHRVPGHRGKCRSPHGHRARVEVTVTGTVPRTGMIEDFGALKGMMEAVIAEPWDHAFLVHREDTQLLEALEGKGWKVVVLDLPPTAENLALMVAQAMEKHISSVSSQLTVTRVTFYETPNSWATWTKRG